MPKPKDARPAVAFEDRCFVFVCCCPAGRWHLWKLRAPHRRRTCAGSLGEVALLGHGRRVLAFGIAFFLAGHVVYVAAARVADCRLAKPAVALLRRYHLDGYTRCGNRPMAHTLGASLFFISDLAVARQRFIAESLASKAWGAPNLLRRSAPHCVERVCLRLRSDTAQEHSLSSASR